MLIGEVIGNAVSTVKHPSLQGWRLLLVQPLGVNDKPDGEPLLAVSDLGAGVGSKVIISSDGKSTRKLVGNGNSPARWMVLGICE